MQPRILASMIYPVRIWLSLNLSPRIRQSACAPLKTFSNPCKIRQREKEFHIKGSFGKLLSLQFYSNSDLLCQVAPGGVREQLAFFSLQRTARSQGHGLPWWTGTLNPPYMSPSLSGRPQTSVRPPSAAEGERGRSAEEYRTALSSGPQVSK